IRSVSLDRIDRETNHGQPLAQFRRAQFEIQKVFKPVVTNEHLFEFFQKPHVVLKKQPDIVEFVHQRGHAIDSETKRETGIPLRIDTHCAQDVRMHHAGTTQLDPTRVFADATTTALAFETTEIKLRTRLREWEVRWSKTRDGVGTEQTSQKLRDCSLQVR